MRAARPVVTNLDLKVARLKMGNPGRDAIRERVKSLVKGLRQSWQPGNIPYDFCLYHYTDANGLLGILTNKSFWATDIK